MSDAIKMKKSRRSRPAISVSGKTYERLRAAYPFGSLAAYVDSLIVSALDDPKTLANMVARCRPKLLSMVKR